MSWYQEIARYYIARRRAQDGELPPPGIYANLPTGFSEDQLPLVAVDCARPHANWNEIASKLKAITPS